MKPFNFFTSAAVSTAEPLTQEKLDKIIELQKESEIKEETAIAFEVFLISPKRRGIITGITS